MWPLISRKTEFVAAMDRSLLAGKRADAGTPPVQKMCGRPNASQSHHSGVDRPSLSGHHIPEPTAAPGSLKPVSLAGLG